MVSPAHAAPGPSRVQVIRRWAFRVLAVDVVLLGVMGIWLAFEYEPTADTLPGLHGILGVIAVLAALVAAAATVGDGERSTAGVLPAIVVLGVVAGMYLTGPVLAWDSIGANGPIGEPKGVINLAAEENVGSFTKGDNTIAADDYQRNAWLHVVALPVALVVMGGAGIWAIRKRRATAPVPQRARQDA